VGHRGVINWRNCFASLSFSLLSMPGTLSLRFRRVTMLSRYAGHLEMVVTEQFLMSVQHQYSFSDRARLVSTATSERNKGEKGKRGGRGRKKEPAKLINNII
jgi:hypothetical protein